MGKAVTSTWSLSHQKSDRHNSTLARISCQEIFAVICGGQTQIMSFWLGRVRLRKRYRLEEEHLGFAPIAVLEEWEREARKKRD
jgi:hypothetical protein